MAETTAAYPDWNGAAEKRSVLGRLEQAKAVFVGLAAQESSGVN